ncbi:MAG: HNH endonuclease [Candidatus Pacebacteria bacterium]|nr:HNH endonuclease [Candidatus Paceibacterota bacterium]
MKKHKIKKISQNSLLVEYFQNNPKRAISHPEVVDWVIKEFKKRTGKIFRDPDRGIRKLYQKGYLVKIKKGVYKYDPSLIKKKELQDFTSAIKKKIFERDSFKCVMCGKGEKDGVEIHADHIKPKDLGGKATLENGQTLCSAHNFLKKNLKQTETGKKMFIRLYELSKKTKDKKLIKFCTEILEVFETNNINGHIEWNK